MRSARRQLVKVLQINPSDLPAEVTDETKMCIPDWVGGEFRTKGNKALRKEVRDVIVESVGNGPG